MTTAVRQFRHEALLYEGDEGFVAGTLPFVRQGVDAGEDVLVVVAARKIAALRDGLGPDAGRARFADMDGVGRNPARIIPVWRRFAADATAAGRGFRGIGEPVWPGRTPAQLAECHRHEALLNVAFAGREPWALLCPYDTAALDPSVVAEAHRTHPVLRDGTAVRTSVDYHGLDAVTAPFDDPLPEPGGGTTSFEFDRTTLSDVRELVRWHCADAGLREERVAGVVLAVNEVATNSVRYGGGGGRLLLWNEPGAVLVEVRDGGHITEPLAGRELPGPDEPGGRGLWMVNQLCDLVQVRSSPSTGTVVRLHVEG